ncbi:unnamed protein product [Gemmata massiliana]|uniref:Uncharacterized protein n=1 Tax=Gemmata massiliana TaxID=1210884 RepID=A0A6P2CVJ1_9BACT|nr:hypothetical protein [Gemmata massiliana]VTR92923.1 unnamed protein product [Gemmata massiliana]
MATPNAPLEQILVRFGEYLKGVLGDKFSTHAFQFTPLRAAESAVGLGQYCALKPLPPFGHIAVTGRRLDADIQADFLNNTGDPQNLIQQVTGAVIGEQVGLRQRGFLTAELKSIGYLGGSRTAIVFRLLFETQTETLDGDALITRIRFGRVAQAPSLENPAFEVTGDLVRWSNRPTGSTEENNFYAPTLVATGPGRVVRLSVLAWKDVGWPATTVQVVHTPANATGGPDSVPNVTALLGTHTPQRIRQVQLTKIGDFIGQLTNQHQQVSLSIDEKNSPSFDYFATDAVPAGAGLVLPTARDRLEVIPGGEFVTPAVLYVGVVRG